MSEVFPGRQPPLDALAALAALRRAGRRAEELAAATGTPLVQAVDGKIVLVYPTLESIREPDDS